jgi:hypothetical protein
VVPSVLLRYLLERFIGTEGVLPQALEEYRLFHREVEYTVMLHQVEMADWLKQVLLSDK